MKLGFNRTRLKLRVLVCMAGSLPCKEECRLYDLGSTWDKQQECIISAAGVRDRNNWSLDDE
jgi:hypothetical protein